MQILSQQFWGGAWGSANKLPYDAGAAGPGPTLSGKSGCHPDSLHKHNSCVSWAPERAAAQQQDPEVKGPAAL